MANDTKIYVGELGAKALYKRLKEQIGKITTYQKVTTVTQEGVPIVDNPNTRTIYLVKDETVIGDDKYKEWIWNSVDLWECIGTTSIPENAWKQWSEDNGSTGSADSVYIGKNIVLGRDESYSLGKDNTVEVTDDTVYTGTDVVEIGTSNTATNAANAYQLGRENTVSGHNISYVDPTLHGLALNVGRNNAITSEGVNLGKDNAASYFGVNIGQRNEAHNSSYSMGNRVYANNASFAIGNGESNALTSTITLASYQLSDYTYVHASQFRQKTPYTYCKLAAIYFNETTSEYEWIPIDDYGRTAIWGGNSLSLLVNDDLKTYLSIWTSYESAGKVVGYFDTNGNFVADSSNPASKTYYKVIKVTAKNGGSISRTFYASMQDATWPKSISNLKTYVGRPNPNYKYPDPGTILNEAQYAELRQNTIQIVGGYNDVYINPNDLSGTVYRSSNGYYPVIGDYEVYGFDKDNEFVPYNEITGKDVQPADCYWKTVTIDKIGTHTFNYDEVFDEPVRIQSNNNSIVLSNGLAEIDEHSIALVSNVYSAKVDIQGEHKSSFSFTTVTFTVGTLDQSTGRASWNSSITMQCPNVVGSSDYTNTIAFPKAVVDDDSIGIIGAGSTTYSRVNGASIGIGSGLTVQGYSFGIGRDSDVSGASYSIGKNNIVSSKSYVFGQDNTSIREESIALGCLNYEIGDFYIGESRYYGRAVALGYNNRQVAQQSVAIGTNNSTVYYNSVCIGSNHNTVNSSAVSIGVGNSRIGSASVAIGSGLYDIDGSSICFGMGSTASNASFVAGNGCAGSSAIVMGMGAKGYGGSIVFGNGSEGRNGAVILGIGNKATESNTSVYPDNFYANAVVLGIGNQVRNVRESLNKNGWTSMVTTCGIAIGSYIKGYGHNFISLGCRNTLGDPDLWNADGRSTVTDNDGFMTAIGFDCVAFRNYDFAYGYQSTAKGGENIAFQHSTATGYRNIAMVDSTLTDCTANIALCESSLTLNNVDSPKTNVIHNTLLHSKITATLGITSNNMFMHTNGNIATRSANGIHRNIIMVGTEHHPTELYADALTNNIIFGFRNGYFIAKNFQDYSGSVAVSATGSIDRNLLINNAYGAFAASTVNDNIINTSELNVASSRFFNGNIVNDSLISVDRYDCNVVTNVIIGKSKIDVRLKSNVCQNFLMYSYLSDNDNGTAINTGEVSSGGTDYLTNNFLFGTDAFNTHATVSFASPDYNQSPERAYYSPSYTGESPLTAKLIDCCNVFNFGDNLVKGVNFEFVFGNGHNVHSSKVGFVYGTGNETAYTTGSIVMGERNYVIGTHKRSEGEVTHTVILGSNNLVKAACDTEYNMIFGTNNSIVGSFNTVTKTSAQIASLPTGVKEYIKVNADCIRPRPSSTVYSISRYYTYLYSNGCLYAYSGTPSSKTIVEVSSTSQLASYYLYGTMTEGTWYKATSGSSYQVNAQGGSWLEPGRVYYHYNDTLSDLGICYDSSNNISIYNSNNRILGISNTIHDHVMDYTIVGAANVVSCTDFTDDFTYAISNGFVQGNNNSAENGSNIISMGNGNVSTGHNSVAIGCQLISKQWQTVIGKYNKAIDGPNRLASETPQDSSKALFIVGNGYSSRDDAYWQDEQYITRSNALELYANGNLKLAGSVDTAFVLANNGITSLGPINVPHNVITAKNLPSAPSADGQYALACDVVNGEATYRWVAIGTTNS